MIDNNKKYKAFTIQEMMVVLIIAALVVSIAILALDLVQKELIGIQKGFYRKTEIRLLEKTLLNDLNSLEMQCQLSTGEIKILFLSK
jgi:competence protein ComGC